MTVEPEQVTTVSRRPPVGMDKPRTLADYQADIIRRFGRLPSWPELAKREGPAHIRYDYAPPPAELSPRLIAQKAAQAAKAAATRQSIVDALTQPLTAADIAHAVKREAHVVRRYLALMAAEGQIVGRKVKQVTVWRRVPEAAE